MRTTLVVLALALALLAAACSTDNEPDASVGNEPDTPQESEPDTPEESEPDADEQILGAGPYPIADLTFTVQLDSDAGATTYRLACLGDTATLTGETAPGSAESMCLALDDLPIRDRLANGAPTDQLCTQQYGGPEIARVTGMLDGIVIDTELHRTDGCGIADWQLLSALLPPA